MKSRSKRNIPEPGEPGLWECVSPSDHDAVFKTFIKESELIGERCRSGNATVKEKDALTKFLLDVGALQIQVQEQEEVQICLNDKQDPPAEEPISEVREEPSEPLSKEMLDALRVCSICQAVFFNTWDLDLHRLKCTRAMKRNQSQQTKVRNKKRRKRRKRCDEDDDLDSESSNMSKNNKESIVALNQTDDDVQTTGVNSASENMDNRDLENDKHEGEKVESSEKQDIDGQEKSDVIQDKMGAEITSEGKGDERRRGVSGKDGHADEPNLDLGSSADETMPEEQPGNAVRSTSAERACDDDDDQQDNLTIVETCNTNADLIEAVEQRNDGEGGDQIGETNMSVEESAAEVDEVSEESILRADQGRSEDDVPMQIGIDGESMVKREGENEQSKSFVCDVCNEGFTSGSLLQNHSVTAHFKCTTCGKALKSKCSLARHLNRHKNQATGNVYTCSVCRKTFDDKYVHATHVKTHFAEKVECEFCHLKFTGARSLSRHVNSKHTHKEQYPCDECDKVFYIEYDLKMHVRRWHARDEVWICGVCGKHFYNPADLHVHEKNVHVASNQHLCELCGASYKSKGNLKQHHLTAHTDSYKYSCEICGKKFKRSSHHNAHQKVHTNYRPFKCQKCGKGFRNNTQLEVHLNWHDNIRPFACLTCKKTFLTKGNLEKHQFVHTKAYKYSCNECQRGFPDFSQLRIHLLKAHGIQVPSRMTKGMPEDFVDTYITEQTFEPEEVESQSVAVEEHQPMPTASAEDEPQSALLIGGQHQTILETVPRAMIEVVIDCETATHNPAVDAAASQVIFNRGEDNIIATEALVAMMNSQGIQ